eukprot:TRINITY_DN3863_c0_g1_i1.p1 TRINITY_DN3863_c0_g1~~TRINITY_DN3863_c0_g1_i1.p1  ORF type:complete len:451 (-),score=82.55 TRINITY_DN3863_c0_g1_i1:7-1359(-)
MRLSLLFVSLVLLGCYADLSEYIIKDPFPVTGNVDDCCFDVEDLHKHVPSMFNLLEDLTHTNFFKFFKVNYLRECPFWAEEFLCTEQGGACSVCECNDEEIPETWRDVNVDLSSLSKWTTDFPELMFTHVDDQDEMSYINLLENPEKYTGYSGYNSSRIWAEIYKHNCFQSGRVEEMCFEERVFFRLVSGFHASINAHISSRFFDSNGERVPNFEMFRWRLGVFPDRAKNIYFSFLFLTKALSRISDHLNEMSLDTGDQAADLVTKNLMSKLTAHPIIDEVERFELSHMFASQDKAQLRSEFQKKFVNITQMMDCVGCETCKIHAKLQLLGLGTALKVLLANETDIPTVVATLQRNEVIALVNSLAKFTSALHIFDEMHDIYYKQWDTYVYIAFNTLCVFIVVFCWGRRKIGRDTSELQSHSFISYAVFCLKKKKTTPHSTSLDNLTMHH